ncbi:MAG: hypothetical protein AAFO91_10030 [Bacteroidota bacterium]
MKILFVIILVAAGVIFGWVLFNDLVVSEVSETPEKHSSTSVTDQGEIIDQSEKAEITRTASRPDRAVYINQEWRFSFEYPNTWQLEVTSDVLRSRASMFEIVIEPKNRVFPDPVSVNITPQWWINRLLPEIEAQENIPRVSMLGDREAVVSSFINHSVIESNQYFVLINDEYWLGLSGQISAGEVPGYAEELEIVRSSFRFHEPLPNLSELDVDPYIPDYVEQSQ